MSIATPEYQRALKQLESIDGEIEALKSHRDSINPTWIPKRRKVGLDIRVLQADRKLPSKPATPYNSCGQCQNFKLAF